MSVTFTPTCLVCRRWLQQDPGPAEIPSCDVCSIQAAGLLSQRATLGLCSFNCQGMLSTVTVANCQVVTSPRAGRQSCAHHRQPAVPPLRLSDKIHRLSLACTGGSPCACVRTRQQRLLSPIKPARQVAALIWSSGCSLKAALQHAHKTIKSPRATGHSRIHASMLSGTASQLDTPKSTYMRVLHTMSLLYRPCLVLSGRSQAWPGSCNSTRHHVTEKPLGALCCGITI